MIYALLVEHASQEQIDEIERALDAPMAGVDGYDPDRERQLLGALNATFAASLDD